MKFRSAAQRGLNTYFTGRPCSRGHIAERYMSTRTCVHCAKIAAAAQTKRPVDLGPDITEHCVKLWPKDVNTMSEFVFMLAATRWPHIDVRSRVRRIPGSRDSRGQWVYGFPVHNDDKVDVNALADNLDVIKVDLRTLLHPKN